MKNFSFFAAAARVTRAARLSLLAALALFASGISVPLSALPQSPELPEFTPLTLDSPITPGIPSPAPSFELPRWRFAVDFAGSFRTAKVAPNSTSLTDGQWRRFAGAMRRGFSYGAGITGFFDDCYGLGVRFSGTHYSADGFGLRDDLRTLYFAPEFVMRFPSSAGGRIFWVISFSSGYVSFRETVSFDNGWGWGSASATVRRGGMKSYSSVGFDFRVGQRSFVGLFLGASAGYVSVPAADGKTARESLQAVEFGTGFRF